MDMSKRVAAAVSGLMFAGAAALTVTTAAQANAAIESAAPQGCHHVKWCWKKPHRPGGDNGGGGGGGGGTNFYNPNQNYNPVTAVEDAVV